MTESFEPNPIISAFLMQEWHSLNKGHFGGGLSPPPEISWVEGMPALSQFGRLYGVIALNAQFRDVEENVLAARTTNGCPPTRKWARWSPFSGCYSMK